MDYSKLTKTILDKVLRAMELINNPEIDPEVRQLNQRFCLEKLGKPCTQKYTT